MIDKRIMKPKLEVMLRHEDKPGSCVAAAALKEAITQFHQKRERRSPS